MSTGEGSHKRYKRPRSKTRSTTKPETSKSKDLSISCCPSPPEFPLLAKDSEWVDILQMPLPDTTKSSTTNILEEEEEVLQLVECEDGPEMKPLAIMFPGLLEKDPQTLHGMLNKAMSTTEVTKHLVDLGQKANFTFMKKNDRLLPKDKIWMDKLSESNSFSSIPSAPCSSQGVSSGYDADTEKTDIGDDKSPNKRRRTIPIRGASREVNTVDSDDSLHGLHFHNLVNDTSTDTFRSIN